MPMMGRGSDTRMYSPRSESDKMYSSANEDEDKYSPTSPEDMERRREERKKREEERKEKRSKIKHIKVSAKLPLDGAESPMGEDDGNKQDLERELGLQGGPAGSRGHMLDMATGAKTGTGSAMTGPVPLFMSEPMKDAWSTLLKEAIDYRDEDYIYPHEQIWNDEADEQLMGITDSLWDYVENLSNDDKLAFLNNQGNYFMNMGFQNHFPTTQAEIDLAVAEMMFDAWQDAQLEMPGGIDFDIGGNRKSGEPRNSVRAYAVHPSQWKKLASEPMKDAWSTLLKEDDPIAHERQQEKLRQSMMMNGLAERPHMNLSHEALVDIMMHPDFDNLSAEEREPYFDEANARVMENRNPMFDYGWQDLNRAEPMEDAWSALLKRETPSTIEARRRREARREFRPSTGQFKRPPGGMDPSGATMRRFRARMRGIKGGKKTGLMKPHLSVEMSHRGIATKQPMSKDPQKYRQYMGQSEARKILGNVRTTFSPHARYAERGSYAGPTGAGRLGGLLPGQAGQMRQPALRPMRVHRPRMPRLPRPPMPPMPPMLPSPQSSMVPGIPSAPSAPSSIMMSEERAESEMLKGRAARTTERLNIMRRIMAALERANKLQKAGTRSAMENGHVPAHPAGVSPKDESDPEGPTENDETDAKQFGLDPAGYLVSQRGHMG